MWIGNKNSWFIYKPIFIEIITAIVHMPFYIKCVQEMISMKLGLQNNKEIIV